MARSKRETTRLINKAFGIDFSQFNRLNNLKERYRKYKSGKDSLLGVAKGLGRLVIPTEFAKLQGRERGYVYFQELIENDGYDIHLELVGNKCWGVKRNTRKNDFRASGSDDFDYTPSNIPTHLIDLSFELKKKLKTQSVSFDYFIDKEGIAKIIEISYTFGFSEGDDNFYWDDQLNFYSNKTNIPNLIIEDLLSN